jgi:hypothetical protein
VGDGAAWHAQAFLGPSYDALLQRLIASAAFPPPPLFYPSNSADISCPAMSNFFPSYIPSNMPVTFIGAPTPADGCLAIESVPSGSGTQQAYYLYRFGGLVAVNDLAHRLDPVWPIASAHERQLAAAILSSGTSWP